MYDNKQLQIGDNLKKIRNEKGLSQEEIAKLLGINRSTYSNYENNIRQPKIAQLINIAKKLDVNVNALLDNSYVRANDGTQVKVTYELLDELNILNSNRSIEVVIDEIFKDKMKRCIDILYIKDFNTLISEIIDLNPLFKDKLSIASDSEKNDFINDISEYIQFKLNKFTKDSDN